MSKSNNTRKKKRQEALTMEFSEPVRIDFFSIDKCGNVKVFSSGVEKKPIC